jgi:hypothetical protein
LTRGRRVGRPRALCETLIQRPDYGLCGWIGVLHGTVLPRLDLTSSQPAHGTHERDAHTGRSTCPRGYSLSLSNTPGGRSRSPWLLGTGQLHLMLQSAWQSSAAQDGRLRPVFAAARRDGSRLQASAGHMPLSNVLRKLDKGLDQLLGWRVCLLEGSAAFDGLQLPAGRVLGTVALLPPTGGSAAQSAAAARTSGVPARGNMQGEAATPRILVRGTAKLARPRALDGPIQLSLPLSSSYIPKASLSLKTLFAHPSDGALWRTCTALKSRGLLAS